MTGLFHSARVAVKFTRRETLLGSMMALANLRSAAARKAAQQVRTPGQLRLACVGVGGQGKSDISELTKLRDVEIVALCDVDAAHLAAAAKLFPSAATFRDFRRMFNAADEFDGVLVATPDHTHAVITMMALSLQKHVYCEKPLTRTIHEARAVTEAARKTGVATQMGNQGMASESNRLIKEWLAADAIGAVHSVHVWSDRPTHSGKLPLWWPQGVELPTDSPPVPEQLDWTLWLGPAPERAYHPDYGPFRWRGWWDYGNGPLGDMGIHNLAPVFDALRLDAPSTIQGSSTPLHEASVPNACIVHFQFERNGDRPALEVHWYDGGLMPPEPEGMPKTLALSRAGGILFAGQHGHILVNGDAGSPPLLLPESRAREFEPPAATLPRSIGHYAEWVKGCREGTPTGSHFDFAGPLTETVLLGAICIRLGGKLLHWDRVNGRFINHPEADALLHYQYRDGWTLAPEELNRVPT